MQTHTASTLMQTPSEANPPNSSIRILKATHMIQFTSRHGSSNRHFVISCQRGLRGLIDDWSYAGAAVQTSLHRITLLDHEGMDRGWPVKTSSHLSHTTSTISSTYAPSPPSSAASPHAGSVSSGSGPGRIRLPSLCTMATRAPAFSYAPAFATTPPYSPEDAKSIDLPVDSPTDAHFIDPLKLNERLINFEHNQPLRNLGQISPPLGFPCHAIAPFDEPSWERYLEQYKREMEGVQNEDAPRFRHLAHKVTVDYRIRLEEDVDTLDEEARETFKAWWDEVAVMQKKVQEEIDKVSMPTLTEIKHVRGVYGLHV